MADPLKLSTALANSDVATGSLRTALNGGFLYIFSGPVPPTADAALDMVNDHTQLTKLTVANDGATGLTFEATASLGTIQKTIGQNWSGTNTFVGKNSASSTQLATFFRFISSTDGDDGRTVATTQRRIQGTIAQLGANMTLTSATLTAGNVQAINTFTITQPTS